MRALERGIAAASGAGLARYGDLMKAIVQERYGSPDVLSLREVDTPAIADNEVLVRVRGASVNAYDWHVMQGDPYLVRLLAPSWGLRGPKQPIRGRDFAGQVEAVGPGVTRIAVGDQVFGDLGNADGAFAEYVRAPADSVEPKPINLTFEQAAAVPLAGTTALIGLRDIAKVRAGQRLLINGASGGVGTFAVQLAKLFGAEVTAVCSARNAGLVGSLGADHVIDYTREDFSANRTRYDTVLDLVGNRSLSALRRALTPEGTLVLSGGRTFTGGSLIGPMTLFIKAQLLSRFTRQRLLQFTQEPNNHNLATLRDLIESGKLTPAIDRTYPLHETPKAIHYVEAEHARAKVTITV
ncbi:NAD(P)-dependent alcohol dehydrogenase [Nocardia sp. NPDC052566]|uniref:NAD(P)-dependent alcohol dehydrogenase n=1 Tax=Nocardia sp. NPDC052566 TaxID=3364330 RepID=UPI0037CC3B4A